MIDKYFRVLDDGFVGLKAVMGDDQWIDQCARHARDTYNRTLTQTTNLINFMMRERHTSPFEFGEVCFHVRVPMDCWRQWIRHRTANVNEYSTRYTAAIDSAQITKPNEWRTQAKSNRQGSAGYLSIEDGEHLSWRETQLHTLAREIYLERLEMGVAREQARKDLPLSTYTEAFWKIDLHNLFHFLKLRADEHAQWEIRQYAYAIGTIVREFYPISFAAWLKHVYNGEWPWTITDLQRIKESN